MDMIKGKKARLRSKKLADAREDYAWQCDTELSRLDAVAPMNISFTQYVLAYESELRHANANRRQFAIDTLDGKHIGNCVYYDINEGKGEAELGIMIGNRAYWSQGYGTDAVSALVDHIFHEGKFKRIYLKTLVSNIRAQRCFQKCGFIPCGNMDRDGYSFTLMELSKEHWEELRRLEKASAAQN